MKKNPLILAGIIITIIVIVGAVFVVRKNAQIKTNTGQSQGNLIPQATDQSKQSIEDEEQRSIDTSNWKTHKDEKYGFEIKYNPTWEIKQNPGKGALNDESNFIVLDKSHKDLVITIQKIKLKEFISPRDWYKKKGFGGATLEKDLEINGYPTYYVETENKDVHFFISNENNLIFFNFNERVRIINAETNEINWIDYSRFLPEYKAMVNSIKFN